MPANKNKHIIIEQMTENYTNRSVVKNIDTQFKYYKFPPTTKLNDFDFKDFDIDFSIEDAGFDPVSGMHRIPEGTGSLVTGDTAKADASGKWEYIRRIPNVYKDLYPGNSKYGVIWNGGGYYGYTRMNFSDTLDGNPLRNGKEFIITPDTLDLLQKNGKTIKFTLLLKLKASGTGKREYDRTIRANKDAGIPQGGKNAEWLNPEVRIKLCRRSVATDHRQNRFLGATGEPIYMRSYEPMAVLNWDFFGCQVGDNAKGIMRENHGSYYPKLRLEYIVDPIEAVGYDIWYPQIGGVRNCFFYRDLSYWKIDLIDDPGVAILNPNKRRRLYGKQPTNRFVDEFYDDYDVRKQSVSSELYTPQTTINLNNKKEIKNRKMLYAKIRANNQNVKALINKQLKARDAVLLEAKNLPWFRFVSNLNPIYRQATPQLEDLSFLIWSAKNQPDRFRQSIRLGYEYLQFYGTGQSVLSKIKLPGFGNLGAVLTGVTKENEDEVTRKPYTRKRREVPKIPTSGVFTQTVGNIASGVSKLFGKITGKKTQTIQIPKVTRSVFVGIPSGVSKLKGFNKVKFLDVGLAGELLDWIEAIRQYCVTIYDSVPAGAAAANKKGLYWKKVMIDISKSQGVSIPGLKADLTKYYKRGAIASNSNVTKNLIPEKDILNQFYYIPAWKDGLNHSRSTGDADFSKKVLEQMTSKKADELGTFADAVWGADKIT